MLIFYLLAGVMVAAALVMMLPVLLRRDPGLSSEIDQHQSNVQIARDALRQLEISRESGVLSEQDFDSQRAEVEQSLALSLQQSSSAGAGGRASARITAVLLALALPVSTVAIYFATGMPSSMDADYVAALNQPPASDKLPPVDELLPQLEAHLLANPDDLPGWRLLGVTYLRMQQFENAERALSQARLLAPDNIDILMQLVDARAMSRGGQIDAGGEEILNHALSLAPDDPRGLWMLAMLKQQQGETGEAVSIWQRLLVMLDNEPQAKAAVQALLDEAGGTSVSQGQMQASPEATAPSATAPPSTGAVVSLQVTLDSGLADGLSPDTAVFIYAKAMQGPPMPLAVVRRQVSDLPLTIKLSDEMAMMPQLRLSQFDRVVVGARVSHSGDPVAQKGDFFTEIGDINVGDGSVISLSIDQQVK
ncbi:MAG: c-type cytochrome biogenesis protein CcmI [Gammaproteobacteria bacterium]|nr:c-type cytochrome biogenesis protein CcmI [Gammaproteobacteria bacterium]